MKIAMQTLRTHRLARRCRPLTGATTIGRTLTASAATGRPTGAAMRTRAKPVEATAAQMDDGPASVARS